MPRTKSVDWAMDMQIFSRVNSCIPNCIRWRGQSFQVLFFPQFKLPDKQDPFHLLSWVHMCVCVCVWVCYPYSPGFHLPTAFRISISISISATWAASPSVLSTFACWFFQLLNNFSFLFQLSPDEPLSHSHYPDRLLLISSWLGPQFVSLFVPPSLLFFGPSATFFFPAVFFFLLYLCLCVCGCVCVLCFFFVIHTNISCGTEREREGREQEGSAKSRLWRMCVCLDSDWTHQCDTHTHATPTHIHTDTHSGKYIYPGHSEAPPTSV